MANGLAVFALESGKSFGADVASRMGVALAPHEERSFEDGEHKARPLESVRGCDVYVVQSLHGSEGESVNDKLIRLLFFVGALKDAAAARVTAVIPYLCYARKDRRTKSRDPVATRYVAGLFEAVGVDRVVTLDVHNLAAFQNAFRCQTENLEAAGLLADHFAARLKGRDIAVVSPDAGGLKRADWFRTLLSRATGTDIATAFVEKYRSRGVVSGGAVVGDVDGRVAIVLDDLIGSGTTMRQAAGACRENGASAVYAAATHGLFVGDASDFLSDAALAGVVVTDSVPRFRLAPELAKNRVTVIPCAPLVAEAISRLHDGGSLVALMGRQSD